MKHVYFTDKKYRWGALFILVIGGFALWTGLPWYYVTSFWSLIALIAYFNRNTK